MNDDIKVCRDCGVTFSVKEKKTLYKGGYINQCASCSASTKDAEQKYVGSHGATNKGPNIHIHKTNLQFVRQVLRLENSRGRTANLNFKSVINQSAKEEDLG